MATSIPSRLPSYLPTPPASNPASTRAGSNATLTPSQLETGFAYAPKPSVSLNFNSSVNPFALDIDQAFPGMNLSPQSSDEDLRFWVKTTYEAAYHQPVTDKIYSDWIGTPAHPGYARQVNDSTLVRDGQMSAMTYWHRRLLGWQAGGPDGAIDGPFANEPPSYAGGSEGSAPAASPTQAQPEIGGSRITQLHEGSQGGEDLFLWLYDILNCYLGGGISSKSSEKDKKAFIEKHYQDNYGREPSAEEMQVALGQLNANLADMEELSAAPEGPSRLDHSRRVLTDLVSRSQVAANRTIAV